MEAINWGQYPVSLGETLELCAGLIVRFFYINFIKCYFQDKKGKSSLEHVQEEMLEECGYRVPANKIRMLKRYVTGISISGAAQHLFYAEIVSYLFK